MTRSVATDYMKKNVRCNCICPARVHTPFVDGYLNPLSGPGEGDVPGALGLSTPGRMGTAGGGGADGALPLLGRGLVHHGQAFPIDGGVLVL